MNHKFKIVCEVCGKLTYLGVLATDRGGRLRLFCSEKCLYKKTNETNIKAKETKGWLNAIFG